MSAVPARRFAEVARASAPAVPAAVTGARPADVMGGPVLAASRPAAKPPAAAPGPGAFPPAEAGTRTVGVVTPATSRTAF